MGNNQSNEKPRKRMVLIEPKLKENTQLISYKVLREEASASFIRIYVNNFIFYKDGSYKYIDLANCSPFNEGSMKYGLKLLDMNYTSNYNHTKTFSFEEWWDLKGMTEPRYEEVWKDSEGNFRNSNGNIITETASLIANFGEAFEWRQEHAASIEQSRYANNHAWTKQTSWDMPPGWK